MKLNNDHKTTVLGILGGVLLYLSNVGNFPTTRSDWLHLMSSAFIAGLGYLTNKREWDMLRFLYGRKLPLIALALLVINLIILDRLALTNSDRIQGIIYRLEFLEKYTVKEFPRWVILKMILAYR